MRHNIAKATKYLFLSATLLLLSAALASPASAWEPSKGQTLYVPVYSYIIHGIKNRPFPLTVTLSMRNTDPHNAVTLICADYYDTVGKLVKKHLDAPVELPPLGSTEIIINIRDTSGGSGANFIVRWKADKAVNPLLVEAVMISTEAGQGLSFTSRAVEIHE